MRKTKTVAIEMEGRDKGKQYVLTEMSALAAEKWAARALLALSHAGVQVPEDVESAGMAHLAAFSMQALNMARWDELEPLLDEMLTCVQYVPDPSHPNFSRPVSAEGDIEEVQTILYLRAEVFDLHTGFSIAANLRARMAATSPAPSETESNMPRPAISLRRSRA